MSLALALLGGWRGLALAALAAALLGAAVWRAGQVQTLRAELTEAAGRIVALEADLAAAARRARNMEIRDHAHALAQDRLAPVEDSPAPVGAGGLSAEPDRAAQRLRDLCAADPHCRR